MQCMWTITNIRKHHVDTKWILRENPSTLVYTKIQQTQKALHANVFVYSNLNRCNSIGFHVILGNLVFPSPTNTLSHWKPKKTKKYCHKKGHEFVYAYATYTYQALNCNWPFNKQWECGCNFNTINLLFRTLCKCNEISPPICTYI